MANELNIRIAGEAGQGLQSIGGVLSRVCIRAGCSIFTHKGYMSRVRGGNNFFQIRAAATPVAAPRRQCDIICALDKESPSLHADALADGGVLVYDADTWGEQKGPAGLHSVPLQGLAREAGGKKLYVNAVACGLISGLAGIDLSLVQEVLAEQFGSKGEDIVGKNKDTARAGYEYASRLNTGDRFAVETAGETGNLLLNGNESIALGALAAGCRFYSAYPMTPATSIMDTLAHYAHDERLVVEQAEDEIAAVNMAIGASFAGVRAMTGTSGGGFALMGEGVSLAAMTETPLVVVDSQRPAPATGLPTRTEQADLDFVIHAGHGEFARAVFSPGSIEECFTITAHAFNLADTYQIPVVILTDQQQADAQYNISNLPENRVQVTRHIIGKQESENVTEYRRYRLEEGGVSPRAVPSWIPGVIYADSDEHTEEGHITEDGGVRTSMVEKRFHRKEERLREEILPPVAFRVEDARVVLLGFGSTRNVLREVCERLSEKHVGCIHFPQVWPFPAKQLEDLLPPKARIMTVENNAGGQLARLARLEASIHPEPGVLKYDGRPFTVDELVDELNKRI